MIDRESTDQNVPLQPRMEAEGEDGIVRLYNDRLIIQLKGRMARQLKDRDKDLDLPLEAIAAIRIKKPGLTKGFFYLQLHDDVDSIKGFGKAQRNPQVFSKQQYEQFLGFFYLQLHGDVDSIKSYGKEDYNPHLFIMMSKQQYEQFLTLESEIEALTKSPKKIISPTSSQSPSTAQKADWCPLNTVSVAKTGGYSLVPNLSREQLETTKRIVESRLLAKERELRQAERAADSASRRANAERSRKTAKHFSTRRSLQSIRHSMSEMGSTMAEMAVQKLVADVNQLEDLKLRIDDMLVSASAPSSGPISSQQLPTSLPRFCVQCGSSIVAGDAFCGNCGTAIRPAKAAHVT